MNAIIRVEAGKITDIRHLDTNTLTEVQSLLYLRNVITNALADLEKRREMIGSANQISITDAIKDSEG